MASTFVMEHFAEDVLLIDLIESGNDSKCNLKSGSDWRTSLE